jgi:putative addiction module component (TIGR02574 family)
MGRPSVNIKSMSPEERLALIEEIWDSLDPEDVPVTDAQRAELERRSADLDRDIELGHPLGIPWEEVLRHIRERPR